MSSHSDSELRMNVKYKPKRNLHVPFKAKERMNNTDMSQFLAFRSVIRDHILNNNERRLISAAATNNTEAVEQLLNFEVNPNAVDKQQRSALHLAVSKGYIDVVKLLLEHGANPNSQDIIGNTPLHLAACTSNLQMITILLNAGANVSSLDMHGRNPVQLAQSKLQILRHSWRSGIVDMNHLRDQLHQITDIMISLRRNRKSVIIANPQVTSSTNLIDLEMLKLSINSGPVEEVDDQMTRLMEELKDFSIK